MKTINELQKYHFDQLPHQEGVYFVFDLRDILVYIGKSRDINNRIKTHISQCHSNKSPLKNVTINSVSFVLKNINYSCSSEKAERYYLLQYDNPEILKYEDPFVWMNPKYDIGEVTIEMQREALRNIPMR